LVVPKENIEEENNGYVVFKCNIHGSAGKYRGGKGGGVITPRAIIPFYSRLLDRCIQRRLEQFFFLHLGYGVSFSSV
jgi:hypothetical protein